MNDERRSCIMPSHHREYSSRISTSKAAKRRGGICLRGLAALFYLRIAAVNEGYASTEVAASS